MQQNRGIPSQPVSSRVWYTAAHVRYDRSVERQVFPDRETNPWKIREHGLAGAR